MTKKTAYIFIKDAVIETVVGVDDFAVIDYDLLEYFECPVCDEKITEELYCDDCDIDWQDIPDEEIQIAKYKQYLKRLERYVA